jgi:hypothetical protein
MLDELRPQADPAHFSQAGTKRWLCNTNFPLRYVSLAGFFDAVIHSGLAPDDRIDVIATGDVPAAHAILVVDSVSNIAGERVKVSKFAEYRRTS